MSRLSEKEFRAMNNRIRQFLQRRIEYPLMVRLGLSTAAKDVLEIGCGSGYGAVLMQPERLRSYVGIDLMPEQIALAAKRQLPNAVFRVQNACDLANLPTDSVDVVVIFGILHHIPNWRVVVAECARVLRAGGEVYVEEPDGRFLTVFERLFQWGHPTEGRFDLATLEQYAQASGFEIVRQVKGPGVFGVYRWRRRAAVTA